MTSVHPIGVTDEPDPEPTEIHSGRRRPLDDDTEDAAGSPRAHLSLVVTVGHGAMTASRRDSMARHPSADRKD